MTNPSVAFFTDTNRDEQPLLTDLKTMLRNHAHSHPRHLQKALGPSQVGHPCARHLIQMMLAREAINPQFDPLPSYVGVAAHKAMEQAAHQDNERRVANGQPARWLPEMKVTVSPILSGTCDLYDIQTATVCDYKFPGPTRMTIYRASGPGVVYRTQAHLYGRGYINLGLPVKDVAIWFLPRGGQMSQSLLWSEPYNDTIVEGCLARLESLIIVMADMDLENHPERLAWIPLSPYECHLCPFWTPREHHEDPGACNGLGYTPTHTDRPPYPVIT